LSPEERGKYIRVGVLGAAGVVIVSVAILWRSRTRSEEALDPAVEARAQEIQKAIAAQAAPNPAPPPAPVPADGAPAHRMPRPVK